ncbi:hypothetical protein [Chryseobacterium luquanense]|uniref:Transposase zinc-ribbon domain-containing protein n=1 Tax=Chryseobacterium luquanense TaxID=2983766 RepID=A0ABT3Y4J8_9FLAO|nr:hypothetical protein [Chryseobacterium luquanense]MCX8533063.1 hypothetical protein [Chryseobacterium luquanense]
MTPEIQNFFNSFKNKPSVDYSIADLMENYKKITFKELLKEHNHEVWKKCKCGNEEDLRMRWDCSECGAVLFKPKEFKNG